MGKVFRICFFLYERGALAQEKTNFGGVKEQSIFFRIFSDSEIYSEIFSVLKFISGSEIHSNGGFQKIETLDINLSNLVKDFLLFLIYYLNSSRDGQKFISSH